MGGSTTAKQRGVSASRKGSMTDEPDDEQDVTFGRPAPAKAGSDEAKPEMFPELRSTVDKTVEGAKGAWESTVAGTAENWGRTVDVSRRAGARIAEGWEAASAATKRTVASLTAPSEPRSPGTPPAKQLGELWESTVKGTSDLGARRAGARPLDCRAAAHAAAPPGPFRGRRPRIGPREPRHLTSLSPHPTPHPTSPAPYPQPTSPTASARVCPPPRPPPRARAGDKIKRASVAGWEATSKATQETWGNTSRMCAALGGGLQDEPQPEGWTTVGANGKASKEAPQTPPRRGK